MKNLLLSLCVAAAACGPAGCGSISSTTKRAGITGTAGVAAGAAAYSLTNHNPVATMLSASAGAAIAQFAEGEDPNVRQAGFDEGYVHGQSDAIKREYFLRHAREAEPLTNAGGETVYYVMPGPEVTVDGRKLEPHHVAVRVVE